MLSPCGAPAQPLEYPRHSSLIVRHGLSAVSDSLFTGFSHDLHERSCRQPQISCHINQPLCIRMASVLGQGAEMREVLARALRALAVSPLNCSLILDAGGLEPLTEMLCGPDQELAHQALVVMSLLSKVGRKQGCDDAPT